MRAKQNLSYRRNPEDIICVFPSRAYVCVFCQTGAEKFSLPLEQSFGMGSSDMRAVLKPKSSVLIVAEQGEATVCARGSAAQGMRKLTVLQGFIHWCCLAS